MGGLLIGILATLIQIGVMVGIVVLIVKAVGGRDKTSSESAGVVVRRIFVYLIMLSMLILVAIGLGGLIDAALPESGEITDSSADAARSIAFVIVGLPVFAGLALYTARRLKADSREQSSTGWTFYLTVALIGSLLATMALVGASLSEIASGDAPDRMMIINAVIWGFVWAAHWWVFLRFEPKGAQVQLLAGSAIGLIWTLTGAIATVVAVTSTIYDGLFLDSITGKGIDDLLRPAMILIVGLPVWWWYWFRLSRRGERTSLWNVYTLLLGVLGGLVTAVTGAGIILFSVLDWILGDVSTSAAAHFDSASGALAGILVGGAAWTYHAHVIGDREDVVRDEVDRVYDYLVSAAGLIVAASGVATLIATALKGVSTRGTVATGAGDILPTALTLLIIGVPLWWRYWSTVQRYRRSDPAGELHSITRRIYILGLFGIAGVVAVISLIVIVFVVVEDVLDGNLGSTTVDDSAIAVSLLVTAGALAWYHFAVFREDRADLEIAPSKPPSTIDVPVAETIPRGSLEVKLDALFDTGREQVIVVRHRDGYEILPHDE
jgi:hypothetical protein